MENPSHTPHFQQGTCLFQPCEHHTPQYSNITPRSTPQTLPRPVHQCLSFSSDDDKDPNSTVVYSNSSNEEEGFQMVPLDDKHWTSEETPERTLWMHENGLPHNLCQYPCPYGSNNTPSYMDSLDLSDILDYEGYIVTSSDEEIMGMEEVPY